MFAAGAVYKLGTLKSDSPIGHLVASAYDYVIAETLGFRVDYDKTLGRQVEELKSQGITAPEGVSPVRLDSVTEKCQNAIKDMHRPIVASGSALSGDLSADVNGRAMMLGPTLNAETIDYVSFETVSNEVERFEGRITSYNINTFKGRIYIPSMGRPIPFILSERARNDRAAIHIGESLAASARIPPRRANDILLTGFRVSSRSGQLKVVQVVLVEKPGASDADRWF